MKKESNDWDDIGVNRRKGDRAIFESRLIQKISDRIDYVRDESKEFLSDLDVRGIDNLEIDELGEKARNHISDIADDFSRIKSEVVDSDDIPGFIKGYSHDAKRALNRDEDYVRRAQRRLDKLDSDELVDVYKANIRVIELCDKAIRVNNSNADAYYLKGLALANLEKFPEAIEQYVNSLALKDDEKVWLAIAEANALNGDYEDAINVYDSVLEKDADSFDAIKGKALTYYASGDYKKADEEFKKASSIDFLDESSKKIWDECLEKI
nr:tetratricopeptide repeat protein [uncultured Methanobrevibacter sp.]